MKEESTALQEVVTSMVTLLAKKLNTSKEAQFINVDALTCCSTILNFP